MKLNVLLVEDGGHIPILKREIESLAKANGFQLEIHSIDTRLSESLPNDFDVLIMEYRDNGYTRNLVAEAAGRYIPTLVMTMNYTEAVSIFRRPSTILRFVSRAAFDIAHFRANVLDLMKVATTKNRFDEKKRNLDKMLAQPAHVN
jgi:hypothetical protein